MTVDQYVFAPGEDPGKKNHQICFRVSEELLERLQAVGRYTLQSPNRVARELMEISLLSAEAAIRRRSESGGK